MSGREPECYNGRMRALTAPIFKKRIDKKQGHQDCKVRDGVNKCFKLQEMKAQCDYPKESNKEESLYKNRF